MRSVLALLLLAPLASADVRVVSPAGPYTQIQAAVTAANDGDLVLVKPGLSYVGFHVQAKSLSIVADAGSGLPVHGTVIVSDLVAGQTVVLRGLNAEGTPAGTEGLHYGFSASNNQGSVRCQSCTFTGLSAQVSGVGGEDGTRILDSADVSLVSCSTGGGIAIESLSWIGVTGGCGARCIGSTVTISDCAIYGGVGVQGIWGASSGGGGTGLLADNSTILVSNTPVQGGEGGDGYIVGPSPSPGGPGIASSANSVVRVLDSVLTGGFNGDLDEEHHVAGSAPAYTGTGYDFLVGTARTLTVTPNPLRELQSVNLSFHGAPGEQVFLLVGLETALQWDPVLLANFLIAPPHYRTLFLGTTDAAGDLSVSRPFGDLGGTTQSRIYFLQPLFSGAGGAQQLGTPVTLAVLDQAF